MATHSRILAWRISWTEEPGVLRSIASHRVGHNSATEHTHSIAVEEGLKERLWNTGTQGVLSRTLHLE